MEHNNRVHTPQDIMYMRRALELAKLGAGHVSPNPMVGAVIVAEGRIIGEGWHRRFGEGHAEVNAMRSVRPDDEWLLPQSTVYVTLEPCSHYGKTPPCARMLVEKGVKRVVVGCLDPFPEVAGKGMCILQEAGIKTLTGVLEDECRDLNRKFITAHTLNRPYITLKWAQSADGFIGRRDKEGNPAPVKLSSALGSLWMHRERSRHDAIMVGTGTAISDNPRLDTRLWPGDSPRPVTIDRHGRIPVQANILRNPRTIIFRAEESLQQMISELYSRHKITSLLVEGGAELLRSFIDAGLYDEIRVETSSVRLREGVEAPDLPRIAPTDIHYCRDCSIAVYRR